MIHVIAIIIAIAAAIGIMLLAYTKSGLKFRKDQGANDYVTTFMIAVIIYFWCMDLISLIRHTSENVTLTYAFVIGIPVLLAAWGVYARLKTKEQMLTPPSKSTVGRRLR